TEDFFILSSLRGEPLAGNALIIGCDEEGLSVDCQTDILQIKPLFLDKQMVCAIYSMIGSTEN
ncbi:hypothetical protein ABK046_46360, partial [Streptomyces caeruleatus]